MKTILLIATIVLSQACGKVQSQAKSLFTTERMNNGMLRMENDEAVCYGRDQAQGGGLSCRFK